VVKLFAYNDLLYKLFQHFHNSYYIREALTAEKSKKASLAVKKSEAE
jgi:hypothetical protein